MLLVSTPVLADGLLPPIDSLPIMHIDNSTYGNASYNFQKAFFIQTGITKDYNKVSDTMGDSAKSNVSSFIDNNTPFDSKAVFGGVGLMYMVSYKHHIAKSFKDPFFPKIEHNVDLTPTSASTGIKIRLE
jgi:hypothetical protein